MLWGALPLWWRRTCANALAGRASAFRLRQPPKHLFLYEQPWPRSLLHLLRKRFEFRAKYGVGEVGFVGAEVQHVVAFAHE